MPIAATATQTLHHGRKDRAARVQSAKQPQWPIDNPSYQINSCTRRTGQSPAAIALGQGHSNNFSSTRAIASARSSRKFSWAPHGQAAGSDEVEDEIADRGERAGAGANATAILVHRHVTNVMQAVFRRPRGRGRDEGAALARPLLRSGRRRGRRPRR